MLILTLFSRILGCLTNKRRTQIDFSLKKKLRVSIILMHLRSNLTSEICQKIGGLDRKTVQNYFKLPTLQPFVQKTIVFVDKRKTLVDFVKQK